MLSRRKFVEGCGWTAAAASLRPAWMLGADAHNRATDISAKEFGSGLFGEWIDDEFGLPAFRYTCDQTRDPKAVTLTDVSFRGTTDHSHQVGNDRIVAVASNFGYMQARQDEGAPKFLNDYCPERNLWGGGLGFLSDGGHILSTYYPGGAESFERIFGMGYFRKKAAGHNYKIDQVIYAPFGDDPVLLSEVTITNGGVSPVDLCWVEYWGCQQYQFSFRSWLQASVAGSSGGAAELRRKFSERFRSSFEHVEDGHGLLESKKFLGRTSEDHRLWQAVKDAIAANAAQGSLDYAEPLAGTAGMEDLAPPATFLVSLDGPVHAVATNAHAFFGEGGALQPAGMARGLDGRIDGHDSANAMLLEHTLRLAPGASRTLRFLYGYLPKGFELETLLQRYRREAPGLLARSSERWRQSGPRFATDSEPWVERQTAWNHYYVRSNLTFDDAFSEHILTQGGIYQYVMGLQGAARDPLQHAMPFIFSDPGIVKQILRYTMKEVREDGSIPYAIVGHGVPMPTSQDPASDLPLYLLWVACEYLLGTRDFAFLDVQMTGCAMLAETGERTVSVRAVLAQCFRHLVEDVGAGPHGLMRMQMDDWLDALVFQTVTPALREQYVKVGESVLNSGMAAYVFERYASVLEIGHENAERVAAVRRSAAAQREAVRAQWTGRWFRRAWLGPKLGWLGSDDLWIEAQAWAILGDAATPEQSRGLVRTMDEFLRRPSPIGAMRWSSGTHPERQPPAGARYRVCASLNGMFIHALAKVDGEMAWDEWKKNSFAYHAEAYPALWYGTWSGPDVYNGVFRDPPGGLESSEEAKHGKEGFSDVDFPVMNMHPHAWPLFSAAKMLGLEFTAEGATLRPQLPLHTYRFTSPLFGLERTARGYEGWYAPHGTDGEWKLVFDLRAEDAAKVRSVRVNGAESPVTRNGNEIVLRGRSTPKEPLRWVLVMQ